MSIINTLREKMGRLVVVVVGLSIMAFVLTDLLGPQSSILGGAGQNRDIGEISGETISQDEFVNLVESYRQNFVLQYGTEPNEFLMNNFRNQAWEQLIREIAYGDKFEDLDIVVGTAEQIDMVQGENPAPEVMAAIVNPQTGQFDRNYVPEFLVNMGRDPRTRFQWAQFEQQLYASRKQRKYENLLAKTNYITLAEAQQEYESQVGNVNVDYLYIPYTSVSDSLASVDDNELQAYLDDHEDEFQVEESRSLDYISFPIVPSAADSATYQAEMDDIRKNLSAAADDSVYAMSTTEQGLGFSTYDPTILPVDIADNLATLQTGDLVGPKLTNGIYTLHKLSGIVEGEEEFVRVSHILLKTENMSLAEKTRTRTKANNLLRQARNGADFADLARKNSEDGSGPNGGDLGWYKKGGDNQGKWTEPFEKAAFGARRPGVINRVIESEFGFHIMNVVNAPTKNRYKVATIIVEMTPSFETTNQAYLKVQDFLLNARDYDSFNDYASEQGYSVFSGNNINSNAQSIGRLTGARQLVTWLYGEADRGDVKDFELEDEYVVAVYRYKVEKGTANLNDVRSQIMPKVQAQKKKEYIASKLNAMSGSVQDMATAYGTDAKFYNTPNLTLNSNTLPNVGNAPEAVGAAFGLGNPGQKTAVIGTDFGVVVVELKSSSRAAEIADYTTYVTQLQQSRSASTQLNLNQSIRESAKIVDERYKFY